MKNIAIEKIQNERKQVKGDKKVQAVAPFVADTLIVFVNENEDFAAAVANSEKTLGQCCIEVVKDVGQCLSDMEAYKRAVKFYLPEADLKCEMKVVLPNSGKTLNLSLESFM